MADEQPQKFGKGHASAMLRSGAKELSQVLPAFPAQGIQPVEEAGLALNLTPQEVVKEKSGQVPYESVLESYSQRGGGQEQSRQTALDR
jgi:hypothetical protein